ncbi:MAG: ABC transporter permease, partial [Clostridia bacterium]|nr:ABC transporter permease [Clostridia bacterium]
FAGELRQFSDVILVRLIALYDLDKQIYVQYLYYLKNILTGDFGTSLNRKGTKVVDIIAQGLPYTASLGFVAFCIAMVVGITLGAIAAFSKQPWINAGVAFLATIGVSVPSFLVALLMMLVFGVKLGWLPLIGLSSWKHYIMPATALAFAPIAMISRLVRSGLSEELRQDYITLAKSKGTDPLVVVLRHALKNAILPVITYAGPLLATLVTGSFVVETMFTIPGIGSEFVKSVTSRDYTFIMALTVLYGAFIIIAGIVTDLISAAIDPRVRLK